MCAPLTPIPVARSFDQVGVDVLKLPKSSCGNQYAVDYLTKCKVFATTQFFFVFPELGSILLVSSCSREVGLQEKWQMLKQDITEEEDQGVSRGIPYKEPEETKT